ncbi:hypothetical protein EG68_09569 [Paragonimus skrjabini miyazakii]|uniref:Uncharacterized protein n=1 Tax=Paragonimus skrjabini miyazakii TaxID=59628 RepID=A0A8S9YYB2_9TREM|nr:hypothetical protein EG68_09569 [Paragonimus skrjabini miyazakii]
MEELMFLFSKHTAIIDGAPVHKVECLQQAGCLEDAWNFISQLDLDASIITLPMVGQSSPLSPKRRISSTPFCPTSIVPFSSTSSTSAVIPPPVSPLSTPASGIADNSLKGYFGGYLCVGNEGGHVRKNFREQMLSGCTAGKWWRRIGLLASGCTSLYCSGLRLRRTDVDERTKKKISGEKVQQSN